MRVAERNQSTNISPTILLANKVFVNNYDDFLIVVSTGEIYEH